MLEETMKRLRLDRGEKTPKHGEKTIKIQLDFWTDDIAKNSGKIVPKVCWDSGTIRLLRNGGHEIKGSKSIPFSSLSQLVGKIEEVFREQNVKVLKTNRYVYEP
jgi:hypothetical protein